MGHVPSPTERLTDEDAPEKLGQYTQGPRPRTDQASPLRRRFSDPRRPEVHRRLALAAAEQDISLNHLVSGKLSH